MFKISTEAALDGSVTIENRFIVDYLPYADGDYVKVYVYGLSLAMRKNDRDDSITRLARLLNLDIATVDAAIEYWAERGLMSRLGDDVTYLPPRNTRPKLKNFDVDKYQLFNRTAQSLITERQIQPNEYNEYYSIIEKFDMEWQAMLAVISYCVKLKGGNVSHSYVLAVTRNLVEDGYRTKDDIEDRLEEYGVYYNDLCEVLAVMGKKRPDHETIGLYKKWVKEYKFEKPVIRHVAGLVKKGGAVTLDNKLTNYRSLNLLTIEKIDYYETERKQSYALAKAINRAIGVYYENVDPEITNYIAPWLALGFDDKTLIALAEHCMKNNLKTLADLDAVVHEFFAANATTYKDVIRRIDGETRFDEQIHSIMQLLGVMGAIKPTHRAYYSVWADKYAFTDDIINLAAQKSQGTTSPFAYMNKILVAWHDRGVTTLDGAMAQTSPQSEAAATATNDTNHVVERYSAEELDALFTNYDND